MPAIDDVVLRLRAEVSEHQRKIDQAERHFDQSMTRMERRSDAMAAGIRRGFTAAGQAALSFAGAVATIATARALLEIADTAKQLEAQLRLATRESGNFAQAQEDVRRIAAETRSGLDETAKLYGNFQRNARDLGISQEEAARATETVTKTFKISGAGAVEAAQATRQLVQALQSGVLRGDEFNSVMESSPRLTRLLAESLGIPIGQLRAMAEEGELTSDKLVRAFTDKRFTAGIDAEFKELPVTFAQAMQQVENAAIITFGAFDRGGGFSQALSQFIVDGSDGFGELAGSAQDFGIEVRATLAGLSDVFAPLVDAGYAAFDALGIRAQGLAGEIRSLLVIFDDTVNSLNAGRGSFEKWIDRNVWGMADGPTSNAAGRFDAAYARAGAERRAQIARQDARDNRTNQSSAGPRPYVAPAGGRAARRRSGPSPEAAARKAEQERQQAIREEARRQQELADLEDALIAAKAATVTAAESVLTFQLQQIDRDKDQELAKLQMELKLGKLTPEELKARAEIIEEIAKAKTERARITAADAINARNAEAEAFRSRDEIDTLGAEERAARTRDERNAIARRLLDAHYREEELQVRREAAANKNIDLDEALANLKRRRLADEELLARQSMSPGERYLDDLRLEAENLGDAYEDVAVRGLERMNRAFADNIKSALGLHGVMGDIIGDFIELAIRQSIIRPLADMLWGEGSSGMGGGGGLLGGLFDSIFRPGGGFGGGMKLTGNGKAIGGAVGRNRPILVGEYGPEVFNPPSFGNISPNHALRGAAAAPPAVVRVEVVEGQMFEPRVQVISGEVSAQVVRVSAEALTKRAVSETMRQASRPRL